MTPVNGSNLFCCFPVKISPKITPTNPTDKKIKEVSKDPLKIHVTGPSIQLTKSQEELVDHLIKLNRSGDEIDQYTM